MKWEYAQLEFAISGALANASVRYSHEPRNTEPQTKPTALDALHDLGEQGWEMVGSVASDNTIAMWFKRPINS